MNKKYKIFAPVFVASIFSAVSVFAYAKEPSLAADHSAAALIEPVKQMALEYPGTEQTGVVLSGKGKADKGVVKQKTSGTEVQTSEQETAGAAVLTLAQAKAIAFEHAGIDGTGAVFTKEKLDKGVYELKFSDNSGKYEYEISSINGQILDFEWDIDAAFPADVTLQEAKEIAFEHAGIDGADAVFTKEKLDKGVYELKFSDNSGKYEYEISSINGQILDFEWDIKTLPQAPVITGSQNTAEALESISEAEARRIALEAAGCSEANLKYITSYLIWDHHLPCAYEVKFAERTAPHLNYYYTIDLSTGDILSSGSTSHK